MHGEASGGYFRVFQDFPPMTDEQALTKQQEVDPTPRNQSMHDAMAGRYEGDAIALTHN